jgi:hypothetical protein
MKTIFAFIAVAIVLFIALSKKKTTSLASEEARSFRGYPKGPKPLPVPPPHLSIQGRFQRSVVS